MIFSTFEIEKTRSKIKKIRLISGDQSYSIKVNTKDYDLRFPSERRCAARFAVELLNIKHQTREFLEVF